jgi:hypothetical protein
MCDTRQVHGSPRFSVAFDRANQNRVIGYHLLLGLRESTDQGVTWHDFPAPALAAIANNLTLTAAAFSSSGELFLGTGRGLYRLINSVWTQVLPPADLVLETVNTPDGPVATNAGDVTAILFVIAPNGHELCWVATIRHIYMCDLANNGNTWTKIENGLTITADSGPAVSQFSGDVTSSNWAYVASPIRGLAASYNPGQYYVIYATLAGSRVTGRASAAPWGSRS